MSGLSFRLNRVFRVVHDEVRSARPEEVEALLFFASPFRFDNETTGTDCPLCEKRPLG
jgi:hypothetical protein